MEERVVAVVDDHADTAEALALVLRLAGFATVSFTSGRTFLAEVARLAPEAVLLDLAMPDCDGLEVLRTLRGPLASRIPVVVLSAHADAADLRELARLGVSEVLRKPASVEIVVEAVRRAIAGVPTA